MKKQYGSPVFKLVCLFDSDDVIRTSEVRLLGQGEKGVFDNEIFG